MSAEGGKPFSTNSTKFGPGVGSVPTLDTKKREHIKDWILRRCFRDARGLDFGGLSDLFFGA